MIKLRMDVDYPYSSRFQSFLATALDQKTPRKGYLKNAKILAKMINESPKELKAYWFFTPYTIPDAEMLSLLNPERHEVGLHVARDPYGELAHLEKATGRKVKYYTVHGTARLAARLIWRRKLGQKVVPIPKDFPLIFLYAFPTLNFDWICYHNSLLQSLLTARASVAKGEIIHMHPEWLFQRGTLNHRGPYYHALKFLLETDKDMEGLVTRKKVFAKMADFWGAVDYTQNRVPTKKFLEKLTDRDVDIYDFAERKWCCPVHSPPVVWRRTVENVALLHVTSYDEWWEKIGKKTRNVVRKAEKNGVTTAVVEPDAAFAEAVWKIYRETPIRQGRPFPHYNISMRYLRIALPAARESSTFIGAYYQNELIGFIQLTRGDQTAAIAQILSLQRHMDKSVNNALVAKAIQVCAETHVEWVLYGRMGNHPSLDSFKENNCFENYPLTRFYVPLSRKGKLAMALGLHRDLKDTVPQWLKGPLFPVYNWASRAKRSVRLLLRGK
jgi:hypothetical protein